MTNLARLTEGGTIDQTRLPNPKLTLKRHLADLPI